MSDRRNRRNYYRILHVQPDAPGAVLKSSYRALMLSLEMHPDRGGDHWNAALINEAYEVLSDPAKRAAYDATIDLAQVSRGPAAAADAAGASPAGDREEARAETDRDVAPAAEPDPGPEPEPTADQGSPDPGVHTGSTDDDRGEEATTSHDSSAAADPGAARRGDDGRRRPSRAPWAARRNRLRGSEDFTEFGTGAAVVPSREPTEPVPPCLFCGVAAAVAGRGGGTVCGECRSPLGMAPAPRLADDGRRASKRIRKEGAISVFVEWPQEAPHTARLVDVSAGGVQIVSRFALEPYRIVKLSGTLLDAIARVANCRELPGGAHAIGLEFYSVRYNEARGTFVSTSA